jgi:hypothetical protein
VSESLLRPSPNQRTEETGLSTITSGTTELAPTRAAAAEQFETQSAIVLARRFPRNEDEAFGRLMKACGRTSFAENAEYSFPRGGQTVTGPSVNLAREAARVWGNIRYGLTILRDDDVSRQIEGWAWDLETNTKVTAQDDFRKLAQRKKKGGGTEWITPDERDLRELTNRRAAILVRNCILQLLPSDLIEDARGRASETLKSRAEQDPEGAKKKAILAFGELNVTPAMLEAYLRHPLAQSSPAEIADLRKVYQSIRDGNSTWEEYATGSMPRTVGMPKPKVEPALAGALTEEQLLELDVLQSEAGVPPMAVSAFCSTTFSKDPAALTDSEFLVLKGWIQSHGSQS